MAQLFWICLGGAVGTGARYALATWCATALGSAFPYGTLAVNVLGSFLLAAIMYAGVDASLLSPTVRLALGTGVMGGFTTYSTFNYETLRFFQSGAWMTGALNAAVTLVACAAAGVLGRLAAQALLTR